MERPQAADEQTESAVLQVGEARERLPGWCLPSIPIAHSRLTQVNHSLHSDRLGVMWTTVLVLFVLVVTWFRYRLLMSTAGSFYYCSDDTEKTMTILK